MLSTELRPLIWLSTNSWRVATFAFGKLAQGLLELRRGWHRSAAVHAHERVEILRIRVVRVPRRREIVTRPNGEPPVGGSKIPFSDELLRTPFAKVSAIGEPTRRARGLRVVLVDEGAVVAEGRERLRRADRPVEVEHRTRRGSTAVDEEASCQTRRLAGAYVADRLDARVFATASAAAGGIGEKLFCAVIA